MNFIQHAIPMHDAPDEWFNDSAILGEIFDAIGGDEYGKSEPEWSYKDELEYQRTMREIEDSLREGAYWNHWRSNGFDY